MIDIDAATIAKTLMDCCGYDKPDGEAQAKAARLFGSRVAEFLSRLPQDAKAGDIANMLLTGEQK